MRFSFLFSIAHTLSFSTWNAEIEAKIHFMLTNIRKRREKIMMVIINDKNRQYNNSRIIKVVNKN